MSTPTLVREADLRARQASAAAGVADAAAANAEQMADLLDQRTAGRRFWDSVKAAPRALQGWTQATLRTFKLDRAAGAVADGARYVFDKLNYVFGGIGWVNTVGAVLTTPMRRIVTDVASTALRVVTAPVRWGWNLIKWGLNHFESGRNAVKWIEQRTDEAIGFVQDKVEDGLVWLEERDHTAPMAWLRRGFQARILGHAITRLFPSVPNWLAYGVGMVTPAYGDLHPTEEANIKNAQQVLGRRQGDPANVVIPTPQDLVEGAVHSAAEHIVEGTSKRGPFMEAETVILSDTDPNGPWGKGTAEAVSFVDETGLRRIRLGSQLLLIEDLPESMTMVGSIAAQAHGVMLPADDTQPLDPSAAAVRRGNGRSAASRKAGDSRAPRRAAAGRKS